MKNQPYSFVLAQQLLHIQCSINVRDKLDNLAPHVLISCQSGVVVVHRKRNHHRIVQDVQPMVVLPLGMRRYHKKLLLAEVYLNRHSREVPLFS